MTSWRRLSSHAAERPATPEPTTAIRRREPELMAVPTQTFQLRRRGRLGCRSESLRPNGKIGSWFDDPKALRSRSIADDRRALHPRVFRRAKFSLRCAETRAPGSNRGVRDGDVG